MEDQTQDVGGRSHCSLSLSFLTFTNRKADPHPFPCQDCYGLAHVTPPPPLDCLFPWPPASPTFRQGNNLGGGGRGGESGAAELGVATPAGTREPALVSRPAPVSRPTPETETRTVQYGGPSESGRRTLLCFHQKPSIMPLCFQADASSLWLPQLPPPSTVGRMKSASLP